MEDRLKDKLNQIANSLIELDIKNNKNIGLHTGLTGMLLFHFYYYKFENSLHHHKRAEEIIFRIVELIECNENVFTFCDGISGFFWTIEILKEEGFIETNQEIIGKEIDELLFNQMMFEIDNGNYDFLHGALGIGLYFLKKHKNTTRKSKKNIYAQYLMRLLENLEKLAVKTTNGYYWHSKISYNSHLKDVCDLGLSHGLSSILSFLALSYHISELKGLSEKLIISGVEFIETLLKFNFSTEFVLPNYILLDQKLESSMKINSRLAWCYGDLGVGLTLLKVSELLNRKSVRTNSLNILKSTLNRTDPLKYQVKDAGICHGAFGLAKIYGNIYNKTRQDTFLTARNHWTSIGLDMANHKNIAGFKALINNLWIEDTSLLEGTSGIGLSILEILHDKKSKWGEAFLI